jgi:hypothetical protein
MIQPCCGGFGPTMWNPFKKAWECTDCLRIISNDFEYFSPFTTKTEIGQNIGQSGVCECGSDAVYGSNSWHTTYCPKYTKV